MSSEFRNAEGYYDPTVGAVLQQIRKESKLYRPLVYICSPFNGNTSVNTQKAIRYSRFAVDQGMIPFAPHLLLPQYMKETSERELAMFMDMVFLSKCEQLWVFGSERTEGMQAEIKKAKRKNMLIRYFTENLKEEK